MRSSASAAAGDHALVADADDSLDDYITELILEEARMKDPAYQKQYSSPRKQPPTRTNKRFLASMLRNVDSHNQRQAEDDSRKGRERMSRRPTRRSRWDVRPECSGYPERSFTARQTSPSRGEIREESDYRMSPHIREVSAKQARPSNHSRSSSLPRSTRQWDIGKEMYF